MDKERFESTLTRKAESCLSSLAETGRRVGKSCVNDEIYNV